MTEAWPEVALLGSVDNPEFDDKQDLVEEKAARKSASTILVELAQERYDFGVTDTGDTYGVPRFGPRVVNMLRGGRVSLRKQLARLFFARLGKAAPQQALADALLVVEGMAQETEPTQLALRVARANGALWLDIGDSTGRAIRIAGSGWSIVDSPPVLFRRSELTAALPEPVPGADLTELWSWLNVAPADRPLVAAFLVAALYPDMPHPVLSLNGEQGTGKTTAEKVLVLVLDPTPVPCRKVPRDGEAWVTAAAGSWVVGLDNLSDISDWLSDSICRAVTGDGDIRRRLYTDGELAVFAFRRVIVMSGIDVGAVRGDLADRLLPVGLHTIAEADRLEEDELWPAWREAHPRILGAVLDLAASVARVLSSVRLERKPRMADFARVLAAVDQVLGTSGLDRYLDRQSALAAESLTGDPFVVAIAETFVASFTGTAGELLARVKPGDEKWRAPKGWPANARTVTQQLRKQAPVMRKAGWVVDDDDGRNHRNAVIWTITPPSRPEMARNPDSPDSRDSQDELFASHASLASYEYESSQDDEPECGDMEAPDGH
jgi:hypothetical protein